MTWDVPCEVSRLRGGPNHVACNLVYTDRADSGIQFHPLAQLSEHQLCSRRLCTSLAWHRRRLPALLFVQCDFESFGSTASFDKKIFTGRWAVLCLPNSDTAYRPANLFCLRLPDVRFRQGKLFARSSLSGNGVNGKKEAGYCKPTASHVIYPSAVRKFERTVSIHTAWPFPGPLGATTGVISPLHSNTGTGILSVIAVNNRHRGERIKRTVVASISAMMWA